MVHNHHLQRIFRRHQFQSELLLDKRQELWDTGVEERASCPFQRNVVNSGNPGPINHGKVDAAKFG